MMVRRLQSVVRNIQSEQLRILSQQKLRKPLMMVTRLLLMVRPIHIQPKVEQVRLMQVG